MVKRKVPFAFMAKMTFLPSKASCPNPSQSSLLANLIFWPINRGHVCHLKPHQSYARTSFLSSFLNFKLYVSKVRILAFFKTCEKPWEIWCLTCLKINMELVWNLKSTQESLKTRIAFHISKLAKTALNFKLLVWLEQVVFFLFKHHQHTSYGWYKPSSLNCNTSKHEFEFHFKHMQVDLVRVIHVDSRKAEHPHTFPEVHWCYSNP